MGTIVEIVIYIGIVLLIMAAFAGAAVGIFKNLSR